eukprot:11638519-Alexandrium_andersonii.AAC.1
MRRAQVRQDLATQQMALVREANQATVRQLASQLVPMAPARASQEAPVDVNVPAGRPSLASLPWRVARGRL